MKNVTFIGGGSFGTSLALILAEKGYNIKIYDINREVIDDIIINKRNQKYLKGVKLPDNINGCYDIIDALDGTDYIVLSVPSHVIRIVARQLKGIIDVNVPIICIAKGIEKNTNLRLSQVIEQELPNTVVVLSGPSHAEEVAVKLPTTVVVSSRDMKHAFDIQQLFMTKEFRVYTNDDLIGVEIGGAVKNIIALAAGIADGIGYGDNTKAALITRGMAEITRIGTKLGGKIETFLGLTGIGDLIVTCGSMHSRNRKAGYLIGKGLSVEDTIKEVDMVVEGIKACEAFYELNKEINVEIPIIEVVYRILFEKLDPYQGVDELLSRAKTCEINF